MSQRENGTISFDAINNNKNMTTSMHQLASCEQFQIEEYKSIANDFVRNILGLNPEECFLSDESDLDDFSLMGSTLDTGEMSWDEFVIAQISDHYGVQLKTSKVNLVSLFSMIEQSQNQTLH
jgi:hypothetical protein